MIVLNNKAAAATTKYGRVGKNANMFRGAVAGTRFFGQDK